MDKEYFSKKNQLKRIEARKKHNKNKLRFKKLSKDPNFNIEPKWHLLKSEIDFSFLGSDCHIDLKNSEDYSLYFIEKNELFRILDESFSRVYIKSKIWKNHDEDKIGKVMEHWEGQNKLIPPVIILNDYRTKFLIQDGKHRFAVANYFEATKIPIIILNSIESYFTQLTDNKRIEKIN